MSNLPDKVSCKGWPKAGPGRPKGLQNKTTTEFKQAVANLLNNSSDKIQKWLDRVAKDDPAKALDIIYKFSEFVMPKLVRTELVGDEKNPVALAYQSVDPDDARQSFLASCVKQK